MAESSLSLDYATIARRVMNHQGQGRVYATGTVAATSGVVTLASGTFPTWAAEGVIEIGGVGYTVNTRDSGTQVTLDDTSSASNSASGTAYVLFESTEEEHLMMKDIIQDGLSLFYSSYKWEFLRPRTTITLNAAYDTGTVTIASGVVTLTGGTFPSWAANGELTVNGISYTVNTRDSNTQVTLDDTSLTVASASTYVIEQLEYDLPDDWSGWDGDLTYRPGDADFYPAISIVNEEQIRRERQRQHFTSYRPSKAAVIAVAHDATTGTRWKLIFDVGPDDNYILDYRYRSRPNDLTPTNKYPVGGPEHDRTILEAILKTSEEQRDDMQGVHAKKFVEQLQLSIELHNREVVPDHLGYAFDDEPEVRDGQGTGPWTVNYTGHTLYTGPWGR